MINSVNYNTKPSFGGIVKVKSVFVDKKLSTDLKDIKAASTRIVDLLMKKSDTPETKIFHDVFRKVYKFFDREYQIPLVAESLPRDKFAKVNVGNNYFLVSGKDASELADMGVTYGKKKALVRISTKAAKYGVDQIAKDNYRSTIDEIAAGFFERPSHPTITIYATKDKRNIVRLIGARMENDTNNLKYRPTAWNNTVRLTPKKTTAEKAVSTVNPQKVEQKKTILGQEPRLDFAYDSSKKVNNDLGLSGKNWNLYEKKTPAKKSPIQTDFFDKLN